MKRAVLLMALLLGPGLGCKTSVPPGAAGGRSATAMGHWSQWRDLGPLLEVASSHAPKPALEALKEASALLAEGKAASADRRLAQAAHAAGRSWIAVARADVAALNFTLCIRGVAWRLTDEGAPSPTDRAYDYSEDTRVQPGDVSVEALLTNLQEAVDSKVPALVTQARIARARVAAFAERCAANDDVRAMAHQTAETDLATLAAQGQLTPDLAYLWAGVQMTRFSGAAARPFLLQAREGGFDHPAVTFMLAVIALEERELEQADALAAEAIARYGQIGDEAGGAEAWYVRGEVARLGAAQSGKPRPAAVAHYEKALALRPDYVPAMFALATLALEQGQETEALEGLQRRLRALLPSGDMDQAGISLAADNLERLVILAEEPAHVQLTRDALLLQIDREPDPARRGLRYFFAATLEARLQEFQVAHGHGVLAKEEFAEADLDPPIDVEAFLQRVQP